ncbi:MAG: cyclic nucleotide-binding domain-containing protein [Deltaproteobacteria bacterium]|nr:cyclic nucleotide-binding domain-containing protein [Deltaproteobacteria bacterium]MBW2297611.1 cyclic nucleotide-binding domain-containing protein [Deltaproteobacteria bacterium]
MSLYEMIGDIPLFRNFSVEERKMFAKMEHSVLAYNKGEAVIKEGENYTSLYLLIRGSAQVTKAGYDSPVALLKAGSVFGEISFLTRRARQSNVIAEENILVIKIDDDFFSKLDLAMRDKIKNYLIELLASRLDSMNEALSKIARYARGYAVL